MLLIGGTGLISSEVAAISVREGHEVTLITRGRSPLPPAPGARLLHADATDPESMRAVLLGPRLRKERFDAVIQCVAYRPQQVRDDLETFRRLTDRYVLIATAAAYRTFDRLRPLTEDVALDNPYWKYAQDKIACEAALRENADVPWTIVRPANTYGPSKIPGYVGVSRHPWTLVERIRRGADVLLPGDGTSLWTLTHARDVAAAIVGLAAAPAAAGTAVHVTSDEALTWMAIHEAIAIAAGVDREAFARQAVCVPSDALAAAFPESAGGIYGDKMHPAVYDNTTVRTLLPGWQATCPFNEGAAESVAFFDAHPQFQTVDDQSNARFDALGARYREALRASLE